jgi:SulP family sulfate permease
VGVGVALSLLLQLNQEAIDLAVVRLERDGQGRFVERPAPERLTSRSVVVLDVYGSLFYAGARTLQALLPDPTGTEGAVVVLGLRGRTTFGATFFSVVAAYADLLDGSGGRLYLAGVDPALVERLERCGSDAPTGSARLYRASEVVGESTVEALADAEAWLVRGQVDPTAREG